MTTIAQVFIPDARRKGWTCAKIAAFFEHCDRAGYRLDQEWHCVGGALGGAIWGFETFVWSEQEVTRNPTTTV